jgi:hypothetical protein
LSNFYGSWAAQLHVSPSIEPPLRTSSSITDGRLAYQLRLARRQRTTFQPVLHPKKWLGYDRMRVLSTLGMYRWVSPHGRGEW